MTERAHQCGQVEPRRIRIGDVKWVGASAPEPLYMVTYERCRNAGTMWRMVEGLAGGWFCWEHSDGHF